MKNYFICLFIILITGNNTIAQVPQKEINNQHQAWVSINSTVKLTNKWGFVADVHERRNNFFKDASFHFIRFGVNYWLMDNVTLTAGYAHLWLAPTTNGWKTFSNDNRVYEQAQITSKLSAVRLLQRLRIEQRWQQKIANDKPTGNNKFTTRVRYLMSFTIPVSTNANLPSLVLSDEILVQFGKEVVYNTFDQNRVFVGIRQKVTKSLSFDLGYMFVNQQKASGYQYDHNNTFRCFFYYTPDCRKKAIALQ